MHGIKYPPNLCDLSNEEQAIIEEDKCLWLDAHNMVKNQSIQEIKAYIESIECEITKLDLKNRLNVCYKNIKKDIHN